MSASSVGRLRYSILDFLLDGARLIWRKRRLPKNLLNVRQLFRYRSDAKLLLRSRLFDRDWYLANNSDVASAGATPALHYVMFGAAEGRDPHPSFDTDWYLDNNPDVAKACLNAAAHYLKHGAAEGRDPRKIRAANGKIDSIYLSNSGYVLATGWIDDEGHEPGDVTLACTPLSSTATSVIIQHESVLRHQRPDIGERLRKPGCNFGFVIFDKLTADLRSKEKLIFRITSPSFKYQTEITPEIVSDRRLLPLAVAAIGSCRSGVGWEANLSDFLAGPAGRNLKLLNEAVVTKSARSYYVERFGGKLAAPFTFITASGASQDHLRFQPAEYRHCGIQVPEWIHVCTAPEHAEAIMRLAKFLSEIGEIPNLTLVVMDDNVAPGVAFNIAVEHATSDQITLVGPNLYPMSAHAKMLSDTLMSRIAPGTLQGGLLFYDDATLMHAGIYFDQEIFIRRCNGTEKPNVAENGHLALPRAEHIEKAMPFVAGRWSMPRRVHAVDGTFMRFNKADFEQANGFCDDFISSYWGDADLCLRWSEGIGTVEVNPGIRLLHLDPHGSPLPEACAAWHIDRYFFSEKHRGFLEQSLLSPRTIASNVFPSNLSIGSALEL